MKVSNLVKKFSNFEMEESAMKKYGSVLAVLGVVAGLAACGRGETAEAPNPEVVDNGADEAEVITRATSAVGSSASDFNSALNPEGPWVFGLTSNLETDEELVMTGNAYKSNDEAQGYERKIGLYRRQGGGDRTIVEVFHITAPALRLNSENPRIMGGEVDGEIATINGDVYVAENNLLLQNVQINGDLIFASEEAKNSATAWLGGDETGANLDPAELEQVVTGEIRVAE